MTLITLCKHQWHKDPGTMDGTPKIHAQSPTPILFGRLPNRDVLWIHTSIVTNNMDSTEGRNCSIGKCLHTLRLSDVRFYSNNLSTSTLELCFSSGKVILIDVGMSKAYGGPAGCLVIEKGTFYANYAGHPPLKLPIKKSVPAAAKK